MSKQLEQLYYKALEKGYALLSLKGMSPSH